MRRLIVANIGEVFSYFKTIKFDKEQAIANIMKSQRPAWWMKEGDIFLTHAAFDHEFLQYLCNIKKIDLKKIKIIVPKGDIRFLSLEVYQDEKLLKQLRSEMRDISEWEIVPYYYSSAIADLAKKLNIPNRMKIGVELLDEKRFFLQLADSRHIPIPEAKVCYHQEELLIAANELLDITGELIFKQNRGSGGEGNYVISLKNNVAKGAKKTIKITNKNELENAVIKIWDQLTDDFNNTIICESYHKFKTVISNELFVPLYPNFPRIVNYYEIQLDPLYSGILIPSLSIGPSDISFFSSASIIIAQIVQQYGYNGMISCDAIKTQEDEILFNEVNVRGGGCTHLDEIANCLIGENYMDSHIILTKFQLPCSYNFKQIIKILKKHHLHFDSLTKKGVIIPAYDPIQHQYCDVIIFGESESEVAEISEKVKRIIVD